MSMGYTCYFKSPLEWARVFVLLFALLDGLVRLLSRPVHRPTLKFFSGSLCPRSPKLPQLPRIDIYAHIDVLKKSGDFGKSRRYSLRKMIINPWFLGKVASPFKCSESVKRM
jgi:hypothetical protein